MKLGYLPELEPTPTIIYFIKLAITIYTLIYWGIFFNKLPI
jgi:hypothetical protein